MAGRVQPNRVTWLLWAAAPLIAFAVELDAGVGLRSLIAISSGVGPLAVFAASFVNPGAYWRTALLDWVCAAVAVAGLIGWLVTRNGTVALVLALVADAVAAVPTVRKTWTHPHSEAVSVYLASLVNAAITLLTVRRFRADVVVFPAYIAFGSLLLVLIITRRVRSEVPTP